MKSNEGLKLNTPEPLNDGGRKYNIIYYVLGAIGIIAGFASNEVKGSIGGLLLAMIIGYCIKTCICSFKLSHLREMKFYLYNKITSEELIEGLIPALTPMGMTIEKLASGEPTITYKNTIYDISIKEDNTFTIWWRKSILRALFGTGKISQYRKAVVAMGIIGYHVQKISKDINQQTEN